MFLHLGESTVVIENTIIGIFDLDNTTVSSDTRKFLRNAENNLVVTSVGNEIPKSFVVCFENGHDRVYLSQISTSTLKKRKGLNQLKLPIL